MTREGYVKLRIPAKPDSKAGAFAAVRLVPWSTS